MDVTHERVPERAADGAQVLVDVIHERIVAPSPALTADQRERLHRIAGRCPVALALKGGVRLESELVDA